MTTFRSIVYSLLFTCAINAQWSTNPTLNTPVCNFDGQQRESKIINNGIGEVIIAWRDSRNESITDGDIYAQKLNIYSGDTLWMAGGKRVSNLNGIQFNLSMAADGSGGAFIVWQVGNGSDENWDIFAQHINSNGDILWLPEEKPVTQEIYQQELPMVISDDFGGAIVAWQSNHAVPSKFELYAQRIDSAGNFLWGSGGVSVTTAPTFAPSVDIISDDNGGAILLWADNRVNFNQNIYCQRLDPNGNKIWNQNDVEICGAQYTQSSPRLISDGHNGAIITWEDFRNGTFDIYAQRVDAQGIVQWAVNGKEICSLPGDQRIPKIVSDLRDGAIIAFEDLSTPNDANVLAQRINGYGDTLWTKNGIAVCDIEDNQSLPNIASDDSGGTIISFSDDRSSSQDIYAQRIDSNGNKMWNIGGHLITSASNSQFEPNILKDGLGGAILCWTDRRENPFWDIYAQNINHYGNIGIVTSINESSLNLSNDYILSQNYPNPFNPTTTIKYQIPEMSFVTLKVYDVLGNEIATLVNEEKPNGNYEVEFSATGLPSGVYFYQLKADNYIETKKMILIK